MEKPESIASLLTQAGWAQGERRQIDDAPERKITPSFIRQHSARATGYALLSGMGLRGANYFLQRDYSMVFGYSLSITHALILAKYGAGRSVDARDLWGQTMQHLQPGGWQWGRPADAPGRKSLWQRIENKVAQYPLQTAHIVTLPSGMLMIRSGLNPLRPNPWLVTTGFLGLLGSSAIIFAPEKVKSVEAQERPIGRELWSTYGSLPKTLAHAARYPRRIPEMLWDHITDSPKRFNAEIAIAPSLVLGFMNACHQTKQVRHVWPKENPPKLVKLAEDIRAFKQAHPNIQGAEAKHLGKLQHQQTILRSQIGLSQGAGRNVIPALMFSASAISVLTAFFSAIGTKTLLSQQMDRANFDQLYALAAQALLMVPEAERAKALQAAVDYLVTQPDIREGLLTANTLKEAIGLRMKSFAQGHPWIAPKTQRWADSIQKHAGAQR